MWDSNGKATIFYNFLCLCFGLGQAPEVFTKLLKILIALLRRINIPVILYLEDILLMVRTLQEITTTRDVLMFSLQTLGFFINLINQSYTLINTPSYISRENSMFSLQQEQISSLKNQVSYQGYWEYYWEFSQKRISLVEREHKATQ